MISEPSYVNLLIEIHFAFLLLVFCSYLFIKNKYAKTLFKIIGFVLSGIYFIGFIWASLKINFQGNIFIFVIFSAFFVLSTFKKRLQCTLRIVYPIIFIFMVFDCIYMNRLYSNITFINYPSRLDENINKYSDENSSIYIYKSTVNDTSELSFPPDSSKRIYEKDFYYLIFNPYFSLNEIQNGQPINGFQKYFTSTKLFLDSKTKITKLER